MSLLIPHVLFINNVLYHSLIIVISWQKALLQPDIRLENLQERAVKAIDNKADSGHLYAVYHLQLIRLRWREHIYAVRCIVKVSMYII